MLADTERDGRERQAAAEVDGQLQKLKAETGLTDAEIIHVPFLHEPVQGTSIAYQPGIVNGMYSRVDTFVAPDPHGPVIDGKDIFKDRLRRRSRPSASRSRGSKIGTSTTRLSGEVHCGTNSKRALLPDEKWWTALSRNSSLIGQPPSRQGRQAKRFGFESYCTRNATL